MTTTTRGVLRVLDVDDAADLLLLLRRDPVAHCFLTGRVEAHGVDAWRLGGEVWGWWADGVLVSALYAGANVVPVECVPEAISAFAGRLRAQGRRCSSLVGPADEVLGLWDLLEGAWGPARDVRDNQPLMVIDGPPLTAPDTRVRTVVHRDLDVLMPACVAMFTEEVGVSPYAGGSERSYRARVAELVDTGRSFARIDRGAVLFKAEIGAVSRAVAQVQGVWVDPAVRGRGLSVAGMAAVVRLTQATLAPRVSLYVNHYNTPARAAYEHVGFRQVGTFATVLF